MYQFRLFGRFEAFQDNVPLTGFESRKVKELFCYLTTFRRRLHPREHVAEILWEGYAPDVSRKNMRHTLWQLQSVLKAKAAEAPVINADGEFLSFNPQADIWIDIAEFDTAACLARDCGSAALSPSEVDVLSRAIELYRAHFLEGWQDDWCLRERERYQNLLLMFLDKLVVHYETAGEYDIAIHYCHRALREEYARECSHRQLMYLYYLAGDRTAALRQYNRCSEVLLDELGVQPSHCTMELYQQIYSDNAHHGAWDRPGVLRSADQQDWQSEMMVRLSEVTTLLEEIHKQVARHYSHRMS